MVTDPDGPSALRRIADSNMVDGIILLDVTADDPRLPALRAVSKPGVLLGLPRDTASLDIVDLDFGEAARLLVDHLNERGHRELVLVAPPEHVIERGGSYAWRFRDAAVERAARYGLRIHVYHGESRQPGISRSMQSILDAHPSATGLIVHNDATIAALPVHPAGARGERARGPQRGQPLLAGLRRGVLAAIHRGGVSRRGARDARRCPG